MTCNFMSFSTVLPVMSGQRESDNAMKSCMQRGWVNTHVFKDAEGDTCTFARISLQAEGSPVSR